MNEAYSAGALAEAVNRWCERYHVAPASGQTGVAITERNIRYYRTLGLVDAPSSGGQGFGRKQWRQLVAIRLLQAQGLPLSRIRELLYGRSPEELEEIERRGLAELAQAGAGAAAGAAQWSAVRQELWSVTPLTDDLFLVSRRGRRITAGLRQRVLAALESSSAATAALRHKRKD